jgi:hypothetical protein
MTIHPQLLKPGDVFFTRIGGLLGKLIDIGQYIVDVSEWSERSPYSHVGIVVGHRPTGEVLLLEAMPRGSRIRAAYRHELKGHHFVRLNLTDSQRNSIEDWGPALRGKKYGFSDYLALALKHFGFSPSWLERYIRANGRAICSQLVDEVLRTVGYHVFDDGRLPNDVTPGDLYFALRRLGTPIN